METARLFKKQRACVNVKEQIDKIENGVYTVLNPLGFCKHGRTLHRFVSGNISQLIYFQCGQSYRNETHLMWVNIGIRVPECMEHSFELQKQKMYYTEVACNMRTRLGAVRHRDSRRMTTYDLRKDTGKLVKEIVGEIMQDVIPVFNLLSSRESILSHRREYPWFDTLNSHLILLEESMMYGYMGDIKKAKKLFEEYYGEARQANRNPSHIAYLDQLAVKLGLQCQ